MQLLLILLVRTFQTDFAPIIVGSRALLCVLSFNRVWLGGFYRLLLRCHCLGLLFVSLLLKLSHFLSSLDLSLLIQEVIPSLQDELRELWSVDIVHLLMMNKHLRRQSLQYPNVLQGLVRAQALGRVPHEALLYEVCEVWVLISNDQGKRLTHGLAVLASRIFAHDWFQDRTSSPLLLDSVEEFVFTGRDGEDIVIWDTHHLHEPRHLVVLTVSREDGVANIELCHDASKRPHVYGAVIGNAQHNLRRSVEARLNVGVDTLIKESRTTKVDNFNA